MSSDVLYVYRWRKYRPEWYGRRCRLIKTGARNSALIECENGDKAVVSRFALRRVQKEQVNENVPTVKWY